MVEWTIRHETWRLIDLDEPRLGLFVNENVNAEYLEAHLVFQVLRLRRPLRVSYLIVPGDNRLHCKLFKLLPAFFSRYYFWVA